MALYKGQGGATFEVTPPKDGTPQREQFDRQVASGDLVLVDDAPAPALEADPAPEKPKARTRKAQD